MDDARQEVVITIASPGGVNSEREAARAAVERLSVVIAPRLGCMLSVVMWEDEPPGYGRPQSRINERFDNADIFIGIIHQRWGTPTGHYSSGFEEEFSRALERRRAEGVPEIQLYVKDIAAELLEDPGRQLEQVLAFRAAYRQTTSFSTKRFRIPRRSRRRCRMPSSHIS